MCVIVFKPRDLQIPDEETLKKCWEANSDGAGLAWVEGKGVKYVKGFKDFEKLMKFLKDNNFFNQKDLVIHFRLTSKGKVCKEQTHPFPIGGYIEKEKWGLIHGEAEMVLFHNGTLHGFGSHFEEKSDTQEFAEWLGVLREKGASLEILIEIIKKIGYSDRFVLFLPEKIYLTGDFEEKDGYLFSNLLWDRDFRNWFYWGWGSFYSDKNKKKW